MVHWRITVVQLQNSIFQAYWHYIGMIIDRLREQLSLCVVVWNSVIYIDDSRPNKARPPTNHTTPEGPVRFSVAVMWPWCVRAYKLRGQSPHLPLHFMRWHFPAPRIPHFTPARFWQCSASGRTFSVLYNTQRRYLYTYRLVRINAERRQLAVSDVSLIKMGKQTNSITYSHSK